MPARRAAPDPAWVVYAAVLAGLAWVCFGSLRQHQIFFHDAETFRDHERLSRAPSLFFSDQLEHRPGRPLASLVKWLAFGAVGNRPGPAHLVTVAFHLVASLCLAAACAGLGTGRPAAWLAGALFLVNVAHFECVHHISAADFPLALVPSLAAWCCDRRRRRGGGGAWTAATAACVAAGMAAHLSAGAVVAVLAVDRWLAGVAPRRVARSLLPVAGAAVVAALLILTITPAQTTTAQSLRLTAADPVGAALSALRMGGWMAGRLLTTAHWLPPGWLVPRLAAVTTPQIVLGLIVSAGLAWLAARRGSPAAPWAAWTLASIVPFALVAESVTVGGLEGPSHYLYAASAGTSVLAAQGLAWLAKRRRWGKSVTVAVVAGLLASSLVSLRRLESLSWYNSGWFLSPGDPPASVACLRRALASGDDLVPRREAFLRLAVALPQVDEDPYPVLREGLLEFPEDVYLQGAMAVRELESGDTAAAERGGRRLQEAAARAAATGRGATFGTNVAALCHNLGLAHQRAGDPRRAIEAYERALPLTPAPARTRALLVDAWRQWAEALRGQGDLAGAAAARQRAADLAP